MFSFTTLCLVLLRTGKLYPWCNSDGSVIDVMNDAYRGLFLTFAFRYISESHDIKTINTLSSEVEVDAIRKGLPKGIKEFTDLDDHAAKAAMVDAAQLAQ